MYYKKKYLVVKRLFIAGPFQRNEAASSSPNNASRDHRPRTRSPPVPASDQVQTAGFPKQIAHGPIPGEQEPKTGANRRQQRHQPQVENVARPRRKTVPQNPPGSELAQLPHRSGRLHLRRASGPMLALQRQRVRAEVRRSVHGNRREPRFGHRRHLSSPRQQRRRDSAHRRGEPELRRRAAAGPSLEGRERRQQPAEVVLQEDAGFVAHNGAVSQLYRGGQDQGTVRADGYD